MLRLIGFFFGVLVLLRLLQSVPGVGGLFHGFLGFWVVAIGASWGLAHLTSSLATRRKLANQMVALGHVDNPHNRGKRGVLVLAAGRPAKALEDLRAACAGEPEVAEWSYRLGLAHLALGNSSEAAEALARAERLAPSHAYGGVQLGLARAELSRGEPRRALDALERLERQYGDTPQSAYLRGKVLARSGRSDEARNAFASVEALHAQTPKFRRKGQGAWLWRARLARIGVVL